MPYTADREDRLTRLLKRIGSSGKNGTGKRDAMGWASDEFKVAPKTVEGYIDTLMIRGLIMNEYGYLRISDKGRTRLKEQATLPKSSKGDGVAET